MSSNNTPQEQIVYVPVSVAEKPKEEGFYLCITEGGQEAMAFFNGSFFFTAKNGKKVAHYLVPVPLSSLLPQPEEQGEDWRAAFEMLFNQEIGDTWAYLFRFRRIVRWIHENRAAIAADLIAQLQEEIKRLNQQFKNTKTNKRCF